VRVRADHVDRLLGRPRLLLADLFVQHAAERSAEIRKLAIDATQADAFLLPQHLDAEQREHGEQCQSVPNG